MDTNMYIIMGVVFVAVLGFGFIMSRVQAKRMGGQIADLIDFEATHPNFSKIYVQMNNKGAVYVHKIDGVQYLSDQNVDKLGMNMKDALNIKSGDNFQQLTTEKEQGFYILPGTVTLNISYTTTRAGVVYDSVTKYTEASDYVVEVEPNTSYSLAYDKKEKQFTFTQRD